MSATFPVLAFISRSKLAIPEKFIGFGLRFRRELGVDGAGVEQDRSVGFGDIFLEVNYK